jgi:hypothetical protein
MRTTQRLIVMIAVLALLGACQAGSPPASPTGEPSPVSPAPTDLPASPTDGTEPTASPEPTPVPEPTGADFTCNLPIATDGTVAVANIVDVRVGTHEGYDRVVFEFAQGTPDFTLDRAEPPFTEDGSGFPIDVDGDSFLGLVMRGGSKQTDEGTSSYDGPTEFEPGFPVLRHLVEGGDFERQSTWYLGLEAEACVNVFLLDGPPRLVIDLEH